MSRFIVNEPLFDDVWDIEESALIDGKHETEHVGRIVRLGDRVRLTVDRYRMDAVSEPGETLQAFTDRILGILDRLPRRRFVTAADLSENLFGNP